MEESCYRGKRSMRIEALEPGAGLDNLLRLQSQVAALQQTKSGMSASNAQAVNATGVTGIAPVATSANGVDPLLGLDLYQIIELLDLTENKLAIMSLLRRSDWIRILYLLPKELLLNGLRLFSKEKLLNLVMYLPREELIKMMLFLFSPEELVQKMPTQELMQILRSPLLNNRALVRGLRQMDPKYVFLLLSRIYGDNQYEKKKPYELWQIFMNTDISRIREGLKTLSYKALTPFVTGFVKENPELLMLISDDFIFKLFDQMTKPTLIAGCSVLPEELLIRMLTQLPDKFLVQVAAQLDDKTFAEYLISRHANLLYALASAA
jgi:hypothetical protein